MTKRTVAREEEMERQQQWKERVTLEERQREEKASEIQRRLAERVRRVEEERSKRYFVLCFARVVLCQSVCVWALIGYIAANSSPPPLFLWLCPCFSPPQ